MYGTRVLNFHRVSCMKEKSLTLYRVKTPYIPDFESSEFYESGEKKSLGQATGISQGSVHAVGAIIIIGDFWDGLASRIGELSRRKKNRSRGNRGRRIRIRGRLDLTTPFWRSSGNKIENSYGEIEDEAGRSET